MEWLRGIPTHGLLLFALVLARTTGLVLGAPSWNTPEVPRRVRVFLAVSLALLLLPSQSGLAPANIQTPFDLVTTTLAELVIGLGLGLGVQVLIFASQLTGQLMGVTAGMTIGESFDADSESNIMLMSKVSQTIAVASFVAMNGHRQLVAALLETFRLVPLGQAPYWQMGEILSQLVGTSFVLAVRMGAPIFVCMLVVTLSLTLIARTLPQLNVMNVGFGLNAILLFAGWALVLGTMNHVLDQHVEDYLQNAADQLLPVPPLDLPPDAATSGAR